MAKADYKWWKPPFRYVDEGQVIYDSGGSRVLDIRSWGHLTGGGAHGLPFDEAEKIQDALGRRIADLMNADAKL